MRVTQETKALTRQRILNAARVLFASQGFEATATRHIAREAGIASGTLFNYFPTKEDVLARLAADAGAEAVADALAQLESRQASSDGSTEAVTLEEALFLLIAVSLRKLKPLRAHLPVLMETALSPLAAGPRGEAAAFRSGHLEAVVMLAARFGGAPPSATALQLYWTLFAGVLVFWANDTSPRQEDTLALIDESLDMYVTWLRARAEPGADRAAGPT